jgi:hypothetical protein
VAEESKQQRVNRELIELLNELRVALPGVQVLFAFLLTVPFSNGWKRVTPFQRHVFFVSILLTAASTALLIAPSAYHRLNWRKHDKERLLETSNRFAIAGMALMALAMGGVLLLVTDVVIDKTWAEVVAAVAAAVFGWFWYGLPLLRRAEGEEDL